MKMETPKMDVVRFQEADVLAASNVASPVYLTGFADNGVANGEVAFTNGGTDYLFKTKDYNSQSEFAAAVAGAGVANVTFNDSSDPDNHSLSGMYYADVEKDGGGRALILPNGYYYYNPAANTYSYQHQ